MEADDISLRHSGVVVFLIMLTGRAPADPSPANFGSSPKGSPDCDPLILFPSLPACSSSQWLLSSQAAALQRFNSPSP